MILYHKLRKFYKHLQSFGDHFSPSVLEHSIFLMLIFFFFQCRWGFDNMKVKVCRGLHVWRIYCALGAVVCFANSSFLKTLLSFEAGVSKPHLLMKELNQRLKQLAPNQRGSGQVGV